MIHPDIYAALARERTTTFLARAETARLARQLRPAAREKPAGGRPDRGRPVRLRDGSAVLIRPVRPADDGLLRNFGGDLMRRDFGTLEYEVELGRARHLLRIR